MSKWNELCKHYDAIPQEFEPPVGKELILEFCKHYNLHLFFSGTGIIQRTKRFTISNYPSGVAIKNDYFACVLNIDDVKITAFHPIQHNDRISNTTCFDLCNDEEVYRYLKHIEKHTCLNIYNRDKL